MVDQSDFVILILTCAAGLLSPTLSQSVVNQIFSSSGCVRKGDMIGGDFVAQKKKFGFIISSSRGVIRFLKYYKKALCFDL